MKCNLNQLNGHIDFKIIEESDSFEGNEETWQEILIHGDPEGLRSFARLLLMIADTDQDERKDLPSGAREHLHLRPGLEISASSDEVIVGRLDAKGTGEFYSAYTPKGKK